MLKAAMPLTNAAALTAALAEATVAALGATSFVALK